MLLKREEGKKELAATASVRVIPVIPMLLWQQARALVKKKKERLCIYLKILQKTVREQIK